LREQLSVNISAEKALLLNDLLSLTHRIIRENPSDSYYSKKVKAQTAVFGYEIISVMSDLAESMKAVEKKPSREELYFKQFMSLLNMHYITDRSVMFYADKMHLSPKYLSAVVKKVSGQTPSNWIDGLVIMEAKNLLKYSEMNIQEIAYMMNFPNQSFFGKYFKQRTGMTPSAYREN
ncbi:MAG: AraC family transcriptional regulator, partial [Lachnospiraceae bacterium]|nr:AraC family transcriptional regulator [Lachnospiraceae bacterium]